MGGRWDVGSHPILAVESQKTSEGQMRSSCVTFVLLRLCRHLLTTCYMGTVNSSRETRQRAHQLADQIGR